MHVVGLTATPPDELTTEEAELYAALLGPVDFQVPTPAVVRDGHLAPYQELAWLTEPLDGEQRWLDEHELRFRELVTELLDVDESGPLDLGQWVITRLRHRTRPGEDEGELPWSDFQRRHPALAARGRALPRSAGLPLPPGAPRGEAYRRPPDLDDWVVLLEDWVLRCLDGQAAPAAAARREAVAAALRDLGFQLTRTGIRRAASDVDRLLTGSAAKPLALVEVLGAEAEARGDRPARAGAVRRRAGRRAPGRRAARRPRPRRRHRPRRGPRARRRPAHGACSARCSSPARAALRGSGRGGAAGRAAAGGGAAAAGRGGWGAGAGRRAGSSSCAARATGARGAGSGLRPRSSPPATTRALVGTRAFLGEGWNAPCVNCLVDLTSAATGVSVRQMRGRSLRLDPADPEKVASNWDVVCVAPRHAQGDADYERFVRKHRHLHAPADDGTLEAGVGHVHPDLSPFGPPPASASRRSRGRCARARPTATRPASAGGSARPTRATRSRRSCCTPRRPAARRRPRRRRPAAPARSASAACSAPGARAALAGVGGGSRPRRSPLAGLPPGRARRRRAGPARRRPRSTPPPRRSTASPARSATRTWRSASCARRRPRRWCSSRARRATCAAGCATRHAGGGRARHRALDALLGPVERPRYLLSRLVAPPDPSAPALLRVAAGSRAPLATAWHAVPDDLGRRKERAEALATAWRRWLGPAELRFTQRDGPGRAALAEAAAQEWSYDTQRRAVWQ